MTTFKTLGYIHFTISITLIKVMDVETFQLFELLYMKKVVRLVCFYKALKNRQKKNLTYTIRFPLPKSFNLYRIEAKKKKTKKVFCTQFLYFISVINLKESLICLMLHTMKKKIFSCYIHNITKDHGRRNSSENDFEKCEYSYKCLMYTA